MGALESNTTLVYGIHLRESANDGSDFSSGASDYRIVFLGEDGKWHAKDSAGTVTDLTGVPAGAITTSGLTQATARLLGRTTASTGAVEEITVGTGLSLSGGSLTATGGGAVPDSKIAYMSADSLSSGGANALFDLTGASLSLGAGTWLVHGWGHAKDSNASTTLIGLAIHDGSAAVAMSNSSKPAGANDTCHMSVSALITLGGTTTVKLQGISVRTTTTFIRNGAATFGAGATNTACGITAVKVTAA